MSKMIRSGLFLFIMSLSTIMLYAQFDSPYKLSMEGLKPASFLPINNSPSGLDSFRYHLPNSMPLSFKIKQLELQYRTDAEKEHPAVNLGTMYYLGKPGTDFKTIWDNAEIWYEGYRWKLTFSHGYFGPAFGPTSGRTIRKSIYRDILYPWQNAPLSKHSTYKSLYLITNFVYPIDE